MTNLSIPDSWAPRMTCSSSGLPRSCTSGLGSSPEHAARRLPLPAARIRASLVLDILYLGRRWARGTMRGIRKRGISEIADGDIRGAKNVRLGDTGGQCRIPERTALLILLNEMHAARPEGWVLGRLALNSCHCELFRIDPYPSAKQILVVTLRNSLDQVGRPTLKIFGSDQAKFIILRDHPGHGAGGRLRRFRLRLQHLVQHMFVGRLPSVFRQYFKVFYPIRIAQHAYLHLCALIPFLVVKHIFSPAAISTPHAFSHGILRENPGHNLVSTQ